MHEKSAKNASSDVFGQFGGGDPRADVDVLCAGHGDAFRSGALNYHLPKRKKKQNDQTATYHLLFNSYSRRRAERGGGYIFDGK